MELSYSLPVFCKSAPKELLQQYLGKIDIAGINWESVHDEKPFIAAYCSAPNKVRQAIDRDWSTIYKLASKRGIMVITEVVNKMRQDSNIAETLSNVDGYLAKAFWLFMHDPECFQVSQRLHQGEKLGRKHRIRLAGVNIARGMIEERVEKLKHDLSALFLKEQTRGQICKIVYFDGEDTLRWFAYLTDYWKKNLGLTDDGEFFFETWRPLFEIVYVYRLSSGILTVYAPGHAGIVYEIQKRFCVDIFDIDIDTLENLQVNCHLSLLLDRQFRLPIRSGESIVSAHIDSLSFIPAGDNPVELTLQLKHTNRNVHFMQSYDNIHNEIDAYLRGTGLKHELITVSKVIIDVLCYDDRVSNEEWCKLTIKAPNRVSITMKEFDENKYEAIRKKAEEWGLLIASSPDTGGNRMSVQRTLTGISGYELAEHGS